MRECVLYVPHSGSGRANACIRSRSGAYDALSPALGLRPSYSALARASLLLLLPEWSNGMCSGQVCREHCMYVSPQPPFTLRSEMASGHGQKGGPKGSSFPLRPRPRYDACRNLSSTHGLTALLRNMTVGLRAGITLMQKAVRCGSMPRESSPIFV